MARVADVMNLRVVSMKPEATVGIAVARMLEENVGSVAVCEDERLVGIFTERDVLRLAGEHDGGFSELRLRFVMTRAPQVISPDDSVVAAAGLMAERRIRHLPVAQDGNVVGILGIRDVMRCLLEAVWRDHDPAARETARELLARSRSGAATPAGAR
jgi:CBS domain-containing protein